MEDLKSFVSRFEHEWRIVKGKPHLMVWPTFASLRELFELLDIDFPKGAAVYVLGNTDQGYYLFVDLTEIVGDHSEIDLVGIFPIDESEL